MAAHIATNWMNVLELYVFIDWTVSGVAMILLIETPWSFDGVVVPT